MLMAALHQELHLRIFLRIGFAQFAALAKISLRRSRFRLLLKKRLVGFALTSRLILLPYHSRAIELIAIMPGGKLPLGDAALRLIEMDIQPLWAVN